VLFVAAVSGACQSGLLRVDRLASSPGRLGHGEFWLLFSSAAVVQHPVAISLLSFAALSLGHAHRARRAAAWSSASTPATTV
jgi:hypothetical protein